jgi:error-prone DNA polymerase
MGFRLIMNVSKKAMEKLTKEREERGVWSDFESFAKNTSLFRDEYTALAASNAFACLGLDRFEALWRAEAVPFKELLDVEERKLKWRELNSLETAQLDFQSTGVSVEIHPVEQLRERFWCYGLKKEALTLSRDLTDASAKKPVSVFGLVLVRQAPPSAKGMVFYTLEDETGFLNLALSPQVYHKFSETLDRSGFLCVTGQLQKAGVNYCSILVSEVHEEEPTKIQQFRKAHPTTRQQSQSSSPQIVPQPRNFR